MVNRETKLKRLSEWVYMERTKKEELKWIQTKIDMFRENLGMEKIKR